MSDPAAAAPTSFAMYVYKVTYDASEPCIAGTPKVLAMLILENNSEYRGVADSLMRVLRAPVSIRSIELLGPAVGALPVAPEPPKPVQG